MSSGPVIYTTTKTDNDNYNDTHALFFYGTLMAPPVLYRVIYGYPKPDPSLHPSMLTLTFNSALLSNYRRHRVLDADYPAILPESGGNVRGTLVGGLTEGDVWRLDVFEGSAYERRTVGVRVLEGLGLDHAADESEFGQREGEGESGSESVAQKKAEGKGKGKEVVAETYVWCDPPEYLEAEEWDFEVFKRDKMKAWMGGARWDDDEDGEVGGKGAEGVEVDEGFADVDRAIADREKEEQATAKGNGNGNGHLTDPTGGRGVNGHITRQLNDTQVNRA